MKRPSGRPCVSRSSLTAAALTTVLWLSSCVVSLAADLLSDSDALEKTVSEIVRPYLRQAPSGAANEADRRDGGTAAWLPTRRFARTAERCLKSAR
jgi:hypothetical protein